MERATSTLVDGIGAAAATSGVLNQLQGRIFALLYLEARPLALEEIAAELQQSKSNVSLNIRVLVEWHLVRRKPIPGSRKDHYEAATDFFRAMQEIFERRFRWTVRQVLAAVARRARRSRRRAAPAPRRSARGRGPGAPRSPRAFFSLMDAGIGAFVQGEPFPADKLRTVVDLPRSAEALDVRLPAAAHHAARSARSRVFVRCSERTGGCLVLSAFADRTDSKDDTVKASVLVATAACGVFFLTALLLGVWKWRAMLSASDHLAPHYVDTAHRAALLYSFACLVLIHFAELSPFAEPVNVAAVSFPLVFFGSRSPATSSSVARHDGQRLRAARLLDHDRRPVARRVGDRRLRGVARRFRVGPARLRTDPPFSATARARAGGERAAGPAGPGRAHAGEKEKREPERHQP